MQPARRRRAKPGRPAWQGHRGTRQPTKHGRLAGHDSLEAEPGAARPPGRSRGSNVVERPGRQAGGRGGGGTTGAGCPRQLRPTVVVGGRGGNQQRRERMCACVLSAATRING